MFVYYSSDHCIESRPWLAYVLFPFIVAGSFIMISDGAIPDTNMMTFALFIDLSPVLIVLFMALSFFVLWTFGRAVCSKIGNCMYAVALLFSIVMGGLLISMGGEDTTWIISWLISCLAGIFLIFCPANSVDCFIFIPPFRSFSINGFWAVTLWLIADVVFCLFLGWELAVFIHPISFVLGILLGMLLLKIPFVSDGLGDLTLFQWVRGEDPTEDLAWKDSWSEKRKHAQQEQKEKDEHARFLQEQEKQFLERKHTDTTDETRGILCQCGHIVHVPLRTKEKTVQCPECQHQIHVPEPKNQ